MTATRLSMHIVILIIIRRKMPKLILEKVNEVYVKVHCEKSVSFELREAFTFTAPNYQFHPLFKSGVWDGKIRLYNSHTGFIYAGLLHYLEEFCKQSNYEFACA